MSRITASRDGCYYLKITTSEIKATRRSVDLEYALKWIIFYYLLKLRTRVSFLLL